MATKQQTGLYAPDGAKYATTTNGNANLVVSSTSTTGTTKQQVGSQAPDGSIYFCLTDGEGTLV
jgi:hypothetical protein